VLLADRQAIFVLLSTCDIRQLDRICDKLTIALHFRKEYLEVSSFWSRQIALWQIALRQPLDNLSCEKHVSWRAMKHCHDEFTIWLHLSYYHFSPYAMDDESSDTKERKCQHDF
jgi:hypothetical protein